MNKKLALAVFTIAILVSMSTLTTAMPKLLVDVIPVTDEIAYNEVAEYIVELTNNQDVSEKISIPSPRNKWDITIRPYTLNLAPHESKNISIKIAPPHEISASIYSLYFTFNLENASETAHTWINTEVVESSPVVAARVTLIEELEIQETFSEKLLKKEYTVIILNTGNIESASTWETEATNFDSFFLDAEPDYNSLTDADGKKVISWEYSIPPGESAEFKYIISYWSVFASFILLIASLVLLGFYYISKFRLNKEIVISKKKDDSYVKIKLALKNKTGQPQKNITVEDYIQFPFGLSREFGTIKPDAVKKQKDRLVIIWKFDELMPREERIISYKMKSKLEVIGKLIIPPACLKQKVGKKQIQIFSRILAKDKF